MAEASFIWDNNTTGDASPHTEADVADIFKMLASGSGVCIGYQNELTPTVSGTNVLVNTGWAMSVSGHPYRNSASQAVAIPTPAVGTTGHRVVLHEDGAAQTVRLARISSNDGTATIPAATANDITIATLTITTGGVMTLTDARQFLNTRTDPRSRFLAGRRVYMEATGALGYDLDSGDNSVGSRAYVVGIGTAPSWGSGASLGGGTNGVATLSTGTTLNAFM